MSGYACPKCGKVHGLHNMHNARHRTTVPAHLVRRRNIRNTRTIAHADREKRTKDDAIDGMQSQKTDDKELEKALLNIALQESLEDADNQKANEGDTTEAVEMVETVETEIPKSIGPEDIQDSFKDTDEIVRIDTRRPKEIVNAADRETANRKTVIQETAEIRTTEVMNTFIVGRGRDDPEGNLNLTLNQNVANRAMYIDYDDELDPDIVGYVENVRFADFVEERVIDIFFDWSAFYCSALPNIDRIAQNVSGHDTNINVPLYTDERSLPGDINRHLDEANKKLGGQGEKIVAMVVYSKYPLFDWNDKKVPKYVNSRYYVRIEIRN